MIENEKVIKPTITTKSSQIYIKTTVAGMA